LKELFF